MAFLTLEAIGPRAEELAMEAGEAIDAAVGYDPDLDCATFDSDDLDGDQLRAAVTEALAHVDPDWESHLRVAD